MKPVSKPGACDLDTDILGLRHSEEQGGAILARCAFIRLEHQATKQQGG